ncbi:hypothetical protein [Yoonia litorea]|uniref:hypothetical protein n=1 Tax=Yoonia litorea TaxID=1123755 RepID=UPI0010427A40|nr:hypothetical protein [Yoonia litorea]
MADTSGDMEQEITWRRGKYPKQDAALEERWVTYNRANPRSETKTVQRGLNDCDIHYINLAKREDRRQQIEKEFAKAGISHYARFEARENERGSIGCAQSHRDLIASVTPHPDRLTMVCEDDCEFLASRAEIDAAINAFANDERLSVLCLAYAAKNGIGISDLLAISSNLKTTACYIFKPAVADDLRDCFDESFHRLSQGERDKTAAIDVRWRDLQAKYFFALPIKRALRQRRSYSDIVNRKVFYRV